MLVCQSMLVFRHFKVKCKIGSQCVYSVGKFKVKVTLDSLPDGAWEVSGPKCSLSKYFRQNNPSITQVKQIFTIFSPFLISCKKIISGLTCVKD